jgi:hypothetical protein
MASEDKMRMNLRVGSVAALLCALLLLAFTAYAYKDWDVTAKATVTPQLYHQLREAYGVAIFVVLPGVAMLLLFQASYSLWYLRINRK